MPVDQENVKMAIDNFEDDKYLETKDILQTEIKKAVDDYLHKKLELKKPMSANTDVDDNE